MLDKEQKIEEIRNRISYLTEKLKITNGQVDRSIISDKILAAKRELGALESKTVDRIRKVDVIDAPPIADRLERQKTVRSGVFSMNGRNRINLGI